MTDVLQDLLWKSPSVHTLEKSKLYCTMAYFYLTLPSNSSSKFYSDNTLTHFVIKLHSTIHLTGEWEELAEISFKKIWFTIGTDNDGEFLVSPYDTTKFMNENGGTNLAYGTPTVKFNIEPGYYTSINDIVTRMNEKMTIRSDRYPEFKEPKFG